MSKEPNENDSDTQEAKPGGNNRGDPAIHIDMRIGRMKSDDEIFSGKLGAMHVLLNFPSYSKRL